MFSVCQNCYKWIGLGWSRWCKKAQMVQRSWLGRRLLQVLSSLMPHHLVDNKHLITAQKIETAAGAKVEIRGRHVQLWRLPWGRPEQSSRCQRTGTENLWWLLITSQKDNGSQGLKKTVWSKVLSVETCGSSRQKTVEEQGWGHWAACINVISCCPNSQMLIQQIYFCRYSECIFTRYANIFLNVLQIYFCKIFLCMICAPQLKNLKSNTKLWINNPAVHLCTTLIIGNYLKNHCPV